MGVAVGPRTGPLTAYPMRHISTCIDFIELPPPANDNNLQPPSAPTRSVTIDRIPEGWVLPDDLRSEAKVAGVLDPDAHLARLRTGPVGGTRGLFPDQLPTYIRGLFPKWRTWEETDRAKAADKGKCPPGVDIAPVNPAERLKGWPAWVRKSQVAQLKAEGRDAAALAKLFAKTHHINPQNLDVNLAAQAFESFLERVRKEAA